MTESVALGALVAEVLAIMRIELLAHDVVAQVHVDESLPHALGESRTAPAGAGEPDLQRMRCDGGDGASS